MRGNIGEQKKTPRPNSTHVIRLHAAVTDENRRYLSIWLKAGAPMGLCDADVVNFPGAPLQHEARCVAIWVRENPDPAYLVGPRGPKWVVTDAIRDNEIGEYRSFALALNAIRPVMSLSEIRINHDPHCLADER